MDGLTAPRAGSRNASAAFVAITVHVERLVDAGELKDHADAARRLGLTRARLSRIAALLRLPLDVQEGILLGTVRASEPSGTYAAAGVRPRSGR